MRERERAARESEKRKKPLGYPLSVFNKNCSLKERSAREREGKSGSEQERKKKNERARERARYRVIPEHRNHVFDPSSVFLSAH